MIKKNHPSCQVYFSHPEGIGFDICCADVSLNSKILRLVCVYRQPGVSINHKLDAQIISKCITGLLIPNRVCCLAGDFNLPDLNWDLLSAPVDGVHNVFLDLFLNNCLSQLVTEPTCGNNILDLFLTCTPSLFTHCSTHDSLGSSDHSSVLVTFAPSFPPIPAGTKGLNTLKKMIFWSPLAISQVLNFLVNYDWNSVFDIMYSPQTVWLNFSAVLSYCIDNNARVTYKRDSRPKAIHYNAALKRLFVSKATVWRQLRNVELNSVRYIILKSKYRALLQTYKCNGA